MSTDIKILWAIRDIPSTEIKSFEKFILTMLLACIGEKEYCWHSMESLSKICGMAEKNLRVHLKKLSEKQFIFIEKPQIYGRSKSNRYKLNVEKIYSYFKYKKEYEEYSINKERGTNRPKKGYESSVKRGTERTMKNNNEDKKEDAHARDPKERVDAAQKKSQPKDESHEERWRRVLPPEQAEKLIKEHQDAKQPKH